MVEDTMMDAGAALVQETADMVVTNPEVLDAVTKSGMSLFGKTAIGAAIAAGCYGLYKLGKKVYDKHKAKKEPVDEGPNEDSEMYDPDWDDEDVRMCNTDSEHSENEEK